MPDTPLDAPAASCKVVTIIGMGEVGTALGRSLLARTDMSTILCSRPSEASREAAAALGRELETDLARAVAEADLVLVCATAKALDGICGQISGHLRRDAIVADLTASTPAQVTAAETRLADDPVRFVDVAIMGAVSIGHAQTPMVCSGAHAAALAEMAGGLGLNMRAMAESRVGDASRLKLARSVFAKGMEALLLESALAAEAFGFWDELQLQFENFDKTPMREHLDMYLRTHLRHAERRHVEMVASETQLREAGLPSLTTAAAITRYARTVDLLAERGKPPDEIRDHGRRALGWLLEQERQGRGPAGDRPREDADEDV
ncbi:DUF1932 domain-containing protein [Aquicoccus sp. SCR17]|nr:DUF1932 domain-containing protein [Carideicomes alvinocaridis]